MKITITINTDAPAFGTDNPDARTAEVARILDAYTRDLRDTGAVLAPGDEAELRGFDGASVGAVRITEADVPTYAGLSWCAEDVQALREDLTTEQAEEFLIRNEKYLRDRLCELGWDVMSNYLSMEAHAGKLPSQPDDDINPPKEDQ